MNMFLKLWYFMNVLNVDWKLPDNFSNFTLIYLESFGSWRTFQSQNDGTISKYFTFEEYSVKSPL